MTKRLQCQALDSDGKNCKYAGTKTVKYHGESEIYAWQYESKFNIPWVKIKVCKHHYEEHFKHD